MCSVDRTKYHIQIPLPPKIDPSVTMMTVEEKPDVTYSDIGGSKEQIERMREVSKSFQIAHPPTGDVQPLALQRSNHLSVIGDAKFQVLVDSVERRLPEVQVQTFPEHAQRT